MAPLQLSTHEDPSGFPSLLAPRYNAPTTHDPTVKPPWKKHKKHKTPPGPNWALLWLRPPSWRCPPGASQSSGYAGCEYIEAPEVFDPEIEGLPDWMVPKEKEVRLWSGIERVVKVPKGGLEKRGVDGGDGGLVPFAPRKHHWASTSSSTATSGQTPMGDDAAVIDDKGANMITILCPVILVGLAGLLYLSLLIWRLRQEKRKALEAARVTTRRDGRENAGKGSNEYGRRDLGRIALALMVP